MNIHQLSINYLQEQDRILVRINTTASEELRLWLTRRLTIGLMPLATKIIAEHVAKLEAVHSPSISPSATADTQTQQMLAEFKKEASLQKSDFKTPYKDQAAALPLGAEPLLVTEINLAPLANGQLQLSFSEKIPGNAAPRGFQMALEQNLIHGFMHLLDKAYQQSQWAHASSAPLTAPQERLPGEILLQDKPKYLN